jgi:hypothetical protein
MWRRPWGYPESLVVVGAILAGGLTAEWLLGPPPPLVWPGSLFAALGLAAAAVAGWLGRRGRLARFFSSTPLSVALISAVGLLSLLMGLTPQAVPYPSPSATLGLGAKLGLNHLTASWPLTAVYLTTLLSLGAVVTVRFSRRRPAFVLTHLGLWLLLVAAGVGAGDRAREIMRVPEGGLEWRVMRSGGEIVEMPLAIRLDDFDLEEYPARLALIDHATGQPQTADGRLELWQIDPLEPRGKLGDFDLELLTFLPKAVSVDKDTYVQTVASAAVQAAKLKATSRSTGESYEGWVSTGESFRPPQPLKLGDGWLLAMTRPEPRRFVSKVKVFTQEGVEVEDTIEVNKPLKIGSWAIYQRDYDSGAGRSSSWSGFELVKDPWLPMANAGLALLSAGSLAMIVTGRRRAG